jgi:hypothetical protein
MPQSAPRRKLRRITLTKVDRVEAGANPGAHIMLYKAATTPTTTTWAPTTSGWTTLTTTPDPVAVAKATMTEIREAAATAVRERFGDVWLMELMSDGRAIFADYVGTKYAIGYTADDDGTITLSDGDPVEVRMEFVAKTETADTTKEAPVPTDNETTLPDVDAEALAARIAELEAENETLKAAAVPAPTGDALDEDVLKSLPAPVRERLEKAAEAEAQVAVLMKAERRRGFVDFVKTDRLDVFADTADQVADALHAVADAVGEDSDTYKALVRILKSAAAAKASADTVLTRSAGTDAALRGGDAKAKIDALVAEHTTKGIDTATALRAVAKTHPDLMAEYDAERLGR